MSSTKKPRRQSAGHRHGKEHLTCLFFLSSFFLSFLLACFPFSLWLLFHKRDGHDGVDLGGRLFILAHCHRLLAHPGAVHQIPWQKPLTTHLARARAARHGVRPCKRTLESWREATAVAAAPSYPNGSFKGTRKKRRREKKKKKREEKQNIKLIKKSLSKIFFTFPPSFFILFLIFFPFLS